MIREARQDDIEQLVELERESFKSDRISRRSFRHLLTKARGRVFVTVQDGIVIAYAAVLFRRSSATARLYSIAVLPPFRSSGVACSLLATAERAAAEAGCLRMRLEVRGDNEASLSFFERLGYRRFARWDDYYHDHMTALRYEKRLQERED